MRGFLAVQVFVLLSLVFSSRVNSQHGVAINFVRNHIDKNISVDYCFEKKKIFVRAGIKYQLKFDDQISSLSYKQKASIVRPLDAWGLNFSIDRVLFKTEKSWFNFYFDTQFRYGSFLSYFPQYAYSAIDTSNGQIINYYVIAKFHIPDKFTAQANIGLDLKFEVAPWLLFTQRFGVGVMVSTINRKYEASIDPVPLPFDWEFIFPHYQAGILVRISSIIKRGK